MIFIGAVIISATIFMLRSNNQEDMKSVQKSIDNKSEIINGKIFSSDYSIISILPDSQERWDPTEDDVFKAEELMSVCLKEKKAAFFEILYQYTRQYFGIVEEGNKIIWVNAFLDDGNFDWKENVVYVLDGGDSFFNVKVDLVNQTCTEVRVNGVS